jgi:hypothetical protein
MGLARFELASRSPEPRRMDQATPQTRRPAPTGHLTPLLESVGVLPARWGPSGSLLGALSLPSRAPFYLGLPRRRGTGLTERHG